jgi:hypothetical protein
MKWNNGSSPQDSLTAIRHIRHIEEVTDVLASFVLERTVRHFNEASGGGAGHRVGHSKGTSLHAGGWGVQDAHRDDRHNSCRAFGCRWKQGKASEGLSSLSSKSVAS